jgi:hypothetical protein
VVCLSFICLVLAYHNFTWFCLPTLLVCEKWEIVKFMTVGVYANTK